MADPTGEKKNHNSTSFLSRWSNFTDHPHCLSEYLCWYQTLPFWVPLCSEQMFAEALGCHSWGVRTPQVKTTAQKFGAQHPLSLKELSASISWNAIPWARSAFLDFIIQGKSITAECYSCQPHLKEIRTMPEFWLWILNGPSAWAACPGSGQNKSSIVSVFSVPQEHTTVTIK